MTSQLEVAGAWDRFIRIDDEDGARREPRRLDALQVAITLSLCGLRDMHRCIGPTCDLCANPEDWTAKQPAQKSWRLAKDDEEPSERLYPAWALT